MIVRLGDRTLSGGELRRELGGFELEGVPAAFFGPTGTEYDLPFARGRRGIDRDRAGRFRAARSPTGGSPRSTAPEAYSPSLPSGRPPSPADAGGSVRIADVADGTISAAQDPIDAAIGLLPKGKRSST